MTKASFSEELVFRGAMERHMQCKMQCGRLYSMSAAAAPLLAWDAALHVSRRDGTATSMAALADGGPDGGLEVDVSMEDSVGPGAMDLALAAPIPAEAAPVAPTFFRIISTALASKEHVPLPAACVGTLRRSDFVVSMHRAENVGGTWYVEVEPSSAFGSPSPAAVLATKNSALHSLEDLAAWSSQRAIKYMLRGLHGEQSESVADILKAMVKSKAFPDSGNNFLVAAGNDDTIKALRFLESLQFADCLHSSAQESSWCLTDRCMQRLRLVHGIARPVQIFEALFSLVS